MKLNRGRLVVVLWSVGLPLILMGCGGPATDVDGRGRSTEWISESAAADAASDEQPAERSRAFQADQFFASRPSIEIDDEKIANIQQQYSADVAGITFESSPEAVSEAFVRLLHQEDLLQAERLLTLAARAIIHESGLELGPIAGPQAEYRFGAATYATNSRERAFVDCTVQDPALNSSDLEAATYKVTWVLRRESRYGWRIFGMVSEEGGQPQMISFESPQHTLAISQLYDETGGVHEAAVRQAAQPSQGKLR